MSKTLLLLFFLSTSWAKPLPKASTIYSEFTKVFAYHNKEFLLDELNSNPSIFNGGCLLVKNNKLKKRLCSRKMVSQRIEKHPKDNKIYHLKVTSICDKLSRDPREISNFRGKFSLNTEIGIHELRIVSAYFYPFKEKNSAIDKMSKRMMALSFDEKVKGLFLTYCIDPGWL